MLTLASLTIVLDLGSESNTHSPAESILAPALTDLLYLKVGSVPASYPQLSEPEFSLSRAGSGGVPNLQ